jgi:hypothetical protein
MKLSGDVMKQLSAIFIFALLMGSAYAQEAGSANNAVVSNSTATDGQTTGSMNADKPAPGAAAGVDAKGQTQPEDNNSSDFTRSVRKYWNNFIDVFAK